MPSRRHLLTVALAACAPLHAPLHRALAARLPAAEALSERILGDPQAPVRMIEYSSFTCPHCAHFHIHTLPVLTQEFIDTKQLHIVFRDFPLDSLALSVSIIARSVPKPFYFATVKRLFKTQATWTRQSRNMAYIRALAAELGMTSKDIQACLKDQELIDGILNMRLEASLTYEISSTPTFILGEETIAGSQDLQVFREAIKARLA